MARSTISDALLRATIGMKTESGIDMAQIRQLIEEYASEAGCQEQTGEPIGFLWIEDIPQERRVDFMNALSGLSPDPDRVRPVAEERMISANDIWPSRVND